MVITPHWLKKILNTVDTVKFDADYKNKSSSFFSDLDYKVIHSGNLSNRLILLINKKEVYILHVDQKYNEGQFDKFSKELANKNIIDERIVSFDLINYKNFIYKLSYPRVKMIALYHKENFPLPRFALGISDIAGAIRKENLGQVSLADMQLDFSISDILEQIENERPEVLGISATFGQQDILEQVVDEIQLIENYTPLIIIGGSLPVLNYKLILEDYPNVLVALGYGETTMQNVVEYWHHMIEIDEINYVAYSKNNKIIETLKRVEDKVIYAEPELDLLPLTLEKNGVMQLESSRGCTYACSFCPRGHKGKWFGNDADKINNILIHVNRMYNDFPQISRKIFLVDEEFIGYKFEGGVENRSLNVAKNLKNYGFRFETSARIDQVYRPTFDNDWHLNRIVYWSELVKNGLSRILFGMESGVDSILTRFNKKTTGEQNRTGIKLLSLIGVPIRLSYIMFDPLMNMKELIDSYHFIGDTNTLLKPVSKNISPSEIYDIAFNDKLSKEHSTAAPLYTKISYMLVSMESLKGSKYLEMVEKENLTTTINKSMGRVNTIYKDYRIGAISSVSQRWIDRNFALDYLLKSIIKVSNDDVISKVLHIRKLIKESAYNLLGIMIYLTNNELDFTLSEHQKRNLPDFFINQKKSFNSEEDLYDLFMELLAIHFDTLKHDFSERYNSVRESLPDSTTELIDREIEVWTLKNSWELINAI